MYRAARNLGRCAVSCGDLGLQIDRDRALEILQSPPLDFKLLWDFFGKKIVFFAQNKIHGPMYRRGARLQEAPAVFDCSSFTWWLYSLMGIELERRSIDQRRQGIPVEPSDVRAGDLVFATGERRNYWYDDEPDVTVGHVALATGRGTIIHACRQGVVEDPIDKLLDPDRFRGIRRIVKDEDDFYTFSIAPRWEVTSTIDIRWLILQNM